MRTLGLICSGIAVLGLLAYLFMKDATPSFILPMILVSGALAIIFILISIITGSRMVGKKYRCVKCGTVMTGGDPVRYGNVCPNCGGNVFAQVKA
jgi:DNA-directed RNA polymerase subunit RPC12/RpoP